MSDDHLPHEGEAPAESPAPAANEPVLVPRRPLLAKEFAVAAVTWSGRPGLRGTLPATVLRMPMVKVDRENLFAYQKLCGFNANEVLPPTYPHLLGFPLQAKLMASPDFPLAMPGLIHLRNEIIQRDRLFADDEPDVTVHAENLRAHPKGTLVDLVTRVEVLAAVAWESRSTYLARGAGGESETEDIPEIPDALPSAQWRLPGDLGRQYAAISGDVNPIHLHPWTARVMGFRGAIAHGMWTYARTIAALGPPINHAGRSRVWFRTPVLLPSTVRLVRATQDDTTTAALLSSAGKPHLITTWESSL